jgi:hypothetical protein
MLITLGWWLLPLFITIFTFCLSLYWCKDDSGGSFIDMSSFFIFITFAIVWVIPSLIAWLAWALL